MSPELGVLGAERLDSRTHIAVHRHESRDDLTQSVSLCRSIRPVGVCDLQNRFEEIPGKKSPLTTGSAARTSRASGTR